MPVEITILISCGSLFLAALAWRRNAKNDDKADQNTTTTMIVKLENINDNIRDLKGDVKDFKEEIRSDVKEIKNDISGLKERMALAESSTKSAHHRIDEITEAKDEQHKKEI